MKIGITTKLFTVTSLFFILLISTFVVFQTIIFENYYEEKKTQEFKLSFNELNALMAEEAYNTTNKALEYLQSFETKSGAKAAVVSESNNSIRITMYPGEEDMNFDAYPGSTSTDMIFSLPIPENAFGSNTKADILATAVNEFLTKFSDKSKKNISMLKSPLIIKLNTETDGVKNLIAAVQLPGAESSQTYLFAVLSLQPVGEAVSVIKDLYPYFAIFAVILIMLPAFIFSNMISKPLVRINHTAMKMASLDFTAKCEVRKKDEIGSLAHTLNFLSENLQHALKDLKIANSRLIEDIDKERKLEKMRKEFVAGVSHELKTPISLIMGYTEGLRENLVDGADRNRYLEVIADEAQKMGNLVNDMLDLSQLESGKFKLNMTEFNIDELIGYIMRKLSCFCEEKHLKTDLRLPRESVAVKADEFRIEQVIINFLNNAIQHSPEYGVIRVNVIEKASAVRVEVENQGSAIAENELENIWQKFYKVEKSRNRNLDGGTGLGLAISCGILQLHGAKYGAENTPVGVKFFFELTLDSETSQGWAGLAEMQK